MKWNVKLRMTSLAVLALSVLALLYSCVMLGADACFNKCVSVLVYMSDALGCSYEEINVLLFVAIEPLIIGIFAICNYIKSDWAKIVVDVCLFIGAILTATIAILYYIV